MPKVDLLRLRLDNQHLVTPTLRTPSEVVARLGAVQAQDYAAAKWGVGQRTAGATDATVEQSLIDGTIIRTHVLRPTWHFVAPADLRWMLALTAPRVRALMAYHGRQLELDDAAFRGSERALTKALRDGKHLTRDELARALARAKINTTAPQRFMHLMMRAELDGVVCSGARRGKQITYALLEERVPPARELARDEALFELAQRYFTTRGPATVQDFAWWSGLTMTDAKNALASIDSLVERETRDGRTFWWVPSTPLGKGRSPMAHLLPSYDEYFIGFKDRSAILGLVPGWRPTAWAGVVSSHLVIVNGQVVGAWRRTLAKKLVVVELQLIAPLKPAERRAVATAVRKVEAFLAT